MWAVVQLNGVSNGDANGTANSRSQSPTSRSKHAMCVASDGSIYLLGGRSANLPLKDLWKFDPVHNRWEEIRCRGNKPPALQEHTMVSWKNNLFVFGGEVGYSSTSETPLWIFDTVSCVWRKAQGRAIPGQQPGGRRGHTAVVFEGRMVVYGGYQDLRGSTSELWSFDFGIEQWRLTPTTSGDHPPPRHNHTAVVHDGSMWVYGGMTDLMARGDFWKWDLVTHQWSRLRNQKGPGELHSHSAIKALSAMYLFGGEKGGALVQELWRYHFATDAWERIQTEGILPPPRCRHVALANPSLDCTSPSEERISAMTKLDAKTPDSGIGSGISRPVGSSLPPKSISMCFGQQNGDSEKKYFKFRVHPVSRLCSKSTGSDDDDDDHTTQVNLRSLREKISSSRLVRSISSSSYSILHNQAVESARDELERLVEETTPQSQRGARSIQKSHSSDAVLESDSESSTPRHRPHSETVLQTSSSSQVITVRPHSSLFGGQIIAPTTPKAENESLENCCSPSSSRALRAGSSRPGSVYEGPLTTVRDVSEEDSATDDDPPPPLQQPGSFRQPSPARALLIDLEETELHGESDRPKSSGYTSCATLSDLASQTCTPCIEARGMPYSTSDYYAFTAVDEDLAWDFGPRNVGGFLNASSGIHPSFVNRKYAASHRWKEFPVELKTFTPTHQPRAIPEEASGVKAKERAHSWDRESQRRRASRPAHFFSGASVVANTNLATSAGDATSRGGSGNDSESRLSFQTPVIPLSGSPSRRGWPTLGVSKAHNIEQHHWQLCMYLFGGREQGVSHLSRQPMSMWKLYV